MQSKADILEALHIDSNLFEEHDRDDFLQLYLDEWRPGTDSSTIEGTHILVKSVLPLLKAEWRGLTRKRARELLQGAHPSAINNELELALDIALRVWLMINVRNDSVTGYPRRWKELQSVQDVVNSRFHRATPDESPELSRFPRRFRAVDLERIGGIEIQWTTYLDEHLRFDDDNRTLKVFDKKAWILAVKEQRANEKANASSSGSRGSDPDSSEFALPQALLEETIQTLDILFPPWDDKSVDFLHKHNRDFHLLPPYPQELPKLRDLSYWQDRMIDVIIEFKSPPRNWKDVWRDRRDPMAFWTFWLGLSIVLMTFLFGFVSIVIAGVSLREAVEQVKMSGPS